MKFSKKRLLLLHEVKILKEILLLIQTIPPDDELLDIGKKLFDRFYDKSQEKEKLLDSQ